MNRMDIKLGNNIFSIRIYDILVALLIISAFAFDDISYIALIVQAILFIYTFCQMIASRKVEGYIVKFIAWLIIFVLFCILSSCWSNDNNTTLFRCTLSVLQVGLITISLLVYLNSIDRINRVVICYIVAAIIIVIRFFLEVPFSFWGQKTRFTNESLFGKNETAVVLAYATIFLFWYNDRNGRYGNKLLLYLTFGLSGLFMLVSVLMGTKSGIAIFIIGISIILIGHSDNIIKLVTRIALIFLLIFVGYYFIMTLPVLYNSVGYRIELMIGGLLGRTTDASTLMRMKFAGYALKVFRENSILGIGLDGFRYVNIFEKTYAHNNYVELLADLGIGGFLIYYSRFMGYIKNSLKLMRENILPLTLIAILLFVDFTGVTYSLENPYIIISLIIAMLNLKDSEIKNVKG